MGSNESIQYYWKLLKICYYHTAVAFRFLFILIRLNVHISDLYVIKIMNFCRIYIKKVKKFPEFAVDVNQDKKSLKTAMDNAFHQLKVLGTNEIGKEL